MTSFAITAYLPRAGYDQLQSKRPRGTSAMRDSPMPIQICNTCGTSYPETAEPPSRYAICEDERQYVPRAGQAWTTPAKLASTHVNAWRQMEGDLCEIYTQPQFAISQRTLLFRNPNAKRL